MHVEFLGIPRERVGLSEVVLDAATLGEVLTALRQRFPAFEDLIAADRLHHDHLLILSADVGG
jgi:molybdopterin converting factor small subunit